MASNRAIDPSQGHYSTWGWARKSSVSSVNEPGTHHRRVVRPAQWPTSARSATGSSPTQFGGPRQDRSVGQRCVGSASGRLWTSTVLEFLRRAHRRGSRWNADGPARVPTRLPGRCWKPRLWRAGRSRRCLVAGRAGTRQAGTRRRRITGAPPLPSSSRRDGPTPATIGAACSGSVESRGRRTRSPAPNPP